MGAKARGRTVGPDGAPFSRTRDRRDFCSPSRCGWGRRSRFAWRSIGTAADPVSLADRHPLIRVTAMPADTNPYGGVFGGWLMGQMGLACGSFASRRTHGKAILVAADAIKFPGAMAVGDELSVYVELLKQGRTSLRLKAEALARERDGDQETVIAEGEFTFVALDEAGKPREIAAEEEADG